MAGEAQGGCTAGRVEEEGSGAPFAAEPFEAWLSSGCGFGAGVGLAPLRTEPRSAGPGSAEPFEAWPSSGFGSGGGLAEAPRPWSAPLRPVPGARAAVTPAPALPGVLMARGVARALRALDFVTVEELVPVPGLRVDLMALGPKGEIWVVECKSGRADFTSDRKWQGYLAWCDRFFWAVDADFPTDLLPADTGLILADAYDAEILRMAPEAPLAAARRKAVMQKFARHAAARLQDLRDPGGR